MVGDLVGIWDGNGVASGVGNGVGTLVGVDVGVADGSGVGADDGRGVGLFVGNGVGSRDGKGVGSFVGDGIEAGGVTGAVRSNSGRAHRLSKAFGSSRQVHLTGHQPGVPLSNFMMPLFISACGVNDAADVSSEISTLYW